MSDKTAEQTTAELKSQMREAENKLRGAEAAVKDEKDRRLKFSVGSAIGGFLLFAVGAQWFPGYQLDSTAAANSNKIAASAVSEVMAQVCAERFMQTSGLESRLAAFNRANGSWGKASYIREGTWAATPDGERADYATAEKCRDLIAERIPGQPEKAS